MPIKLPCNWELGNTAIAFAMDHEMEEKHFPSPRWEKFWGPVDLHKTCKLQQFPLIIFDRQENHGAARDACDVPQAEFRFALSACRREPVTIPLPKNIAASDFRYTAKCLIFVSAGEKFRIPAAEAFREQVDMEAQNAMTPARFQHFFLHRSRP